MPERIVTEASPLVNPSPDDVRAGMELANRMIHACDPRNRRCAYAGKTWGDFKKAIESLGVTDSSDFASAEFGLTRYGTGYVVVDTDDLGAVEVREMR